MAPDFLRNLLCLPALSFFALACATGDAPASLDGSGGAAGDKGQGGAGGSGGSAGADPGPCQSAEECAALTDPCGVGTCINGKCAKLPANEGAACDDGKTCSQGDLCIKGQCLGASEQPCPASNP